MTSSYQYITFKVDDRVARIDFARPPLNIFNIAMLKEISSALGECSRRELVAIVFAAQKDSRAFSAGVAVCELVAACDIVIASERARFGQPEIKLGVFPPVAAVLLPLVIGDKAARELILTGETIDAKEALRLGLCNHVAPADTLEPKLVEVLAKLRELSSVALEFARKSLDVGRGRTLDAALKQLEDIYLHELMKSSDAKEGVRSFMEKRKPVWRNR
jgi:enoyl-CoA hydratase/carnithine racemase